MRIISGHHKGRKLAGLDKGHRRKGGRTQPGGMRPTSARVKEAIFSSLPDDLAGVTVLDLFAGAGGFGMEALSRGAEAAVFVDSSRQSFRAIQHNLRVTGLKPRGLIIAKKVTSGLIELAAKGRVFDLIFMDPPYDNVTDLNRAIRDVYEKGLLTPTGVLVIEHARGHQCPAPAEWVCVRSQTYGDSAVTFLRPRAALDA